MDRVIMPKRLTAENGAKALLMGKFSVPYPVHCPCHRMDKECKICGGSGEILTQINVPWVVIKDIYDKAVKGLSYPLEERRAV